MIPCLVRTQSQFAGLSHRCRITTLLAFAILLLAPLAHAADDTERFYGTWKAYVAVNGKTITLISTHDASGYHNFVREPNGGDTPAGDGTFSAANGKYQTNGGYPNDGGLYHFVGNDTVVCTNLAGQVVTWKRLKSDVELPGAPAQPGVAAQPAAPQPPRGGKSQLQLQPTPQTRIDANVAAHDATGYVLPRTRPGTERLNPGGAPPQSTQPDASAPANAQVLDASLSPEVNAGLAAMNRKDYNTAWRQFMAAAQKGDSDGEFGLGAMLFNHVNLRALATTHNAKNGCRCPRPKATRVARNTSAAITTLAAFPLRAASIPESTMPPFPLHCRRKPKFSSGKRAIGSSARPTRAISTHQRTLP